MQSKLYHRFSHGVNSYNWLMHFANTSSKFYRRSKCAIGVFGLHFRPPVAFNAQWFRNGSTYARPIGWNITQCHPRWSAAFVLTQTFRSFSLTYFSGSKLRNLAFGALQFRKVATSCRPEDRVGSVNHWPVFVLNLKGTLTQKNIPFKMNIYVK